VVLTVYSPRLVVHLAIAWQPNLALCRAPITKEGAFSKASKTSRWHACCHCAGMTDLILVAVTIGFFALSIAYTRGCDRL
jgi:hypothetical protein